MKKRILLLVVFTLFLTACSSPASKEINIYTSRDYEVDKQIFENFTKESSIKINLVELDNDELVTKSIAEKNSPVADLIIVNGAQYINELNEEEILTQINQKSINENVDQQFYSDKYVGLTYRARAICALNDKVDLNTINTYNDLTKPEFKDQLLVRSSTNGYNQALIMNMIQNTDEASTLKFATDLVKNFAREPEGGDRDQIKAIYAKEGSIALTNSYYYVQMLNSTEPNVADAAKNCELKFLDDTHINMTWVGQTSKGLENKNIDELITYLTSKDVQSYYAEKNGEFPVNKNADYGYFKDFKDLKFQPVNFETLGSHKSKAQEIFNQAGWK